VTGALAYSFFAGMAATLNPCGFVLLPGLVSFYLGLNDGQASLGPGGVWLARAARGILFGLAATAGFVLLFGVIGVAISAGAQAIAQFFPTIGVLVGLALVGTGIWLLTARRTLGLSAIHKVHVPRGSGLRGVFLYGLGYGLASLGCTLPIFLVVVGGALAAGGVGAAALRFVAYGLGMGAVLTAISVATMLSKTAIVGLFRSAMPYVERLGAVLLIGAGIYLVHYWWPFVAGTAFARS
jgi:cytochrome c-type biogenesis protein